MGKVALLAVVAFSVMGLYYTSSTQQGVLEAEKRVAEHQEEMLARNAALVGHSRAEQRLADSFSSGGFSSDSFGGEYEGMRYETEISKTGGKAEILSVAYGTDGSEPLYSMRTRYKEFEGGVASGKTPAPFDHALITRNDLPLGSSLLTMVEGEENDKRNADIHSNGRIINDGGGGSLQVEGFLTSHKDIALNNYTINGAYAPDILNGRDEPDPGGIHNETGADIVRQNVEKVDIPTFNASAIADSFGTVLSATRDASTPVESLGGDIEKNGGAYQIKGWNTDVDLGEVRGGETGAPFVWEVDGKVEIRDGVTIDAGDSEKPFVWYVKDGIEISNGNIEFKGNIVLLTDEDINLHDGSLTPVGDESRLALLAERNVHLDRLWSSDLRGNIFAGNELTLHGTLNLTGSIAAGTFNPGAGYNMELRYRPLESSSWPLQPAGETSIRRVAHNEW